MDAKRWFKHDVSATEDVKLKTLCIRHPNGLGYAVFFAALELMAKQDDCAIGTDECAMLSIADTLKISDYEKVVAVIADCEKYGLFKVDGDRIYSERLRVNMEEVQTSAAKRAAAGKKAAQARWKNSASGMQTECKQDANAPENDAITMQTQCERITNASENDANAMQTQCDSMRFDAIRCQDKDKEKDNISIRSINTSMSFSAENDSEDVEVVEVEEVSIDNIREKKNSYIDIVTLYNQICTSLPRVTKISDKRKKAINARLKSYTVEEIKRCFELAEASDFLKGANNRNWTADFDWLMCDSNLAKVLDNKYQNKTQNYGRNSENITISFAPVTSSGANEAGTGEIDTETNAVEEWCRQNGLY